MKKNEDSQKVTGTGLGTLNINNVRVLAWSERRGDQNAGFRFSSLESGQSKRRGGSCSSDQGHDWKVQSLSSPLAASALYLEALRGECDWPAGVISQACHSGVTGQ